MESETAARATLRMYLLGGFRVAIGSRVMDETAWSRRKARALLALLALAPSHRLHREQVMDLLWPDLPPDAAANNLRFTLHVVRRALSEHAESDACFVASCGHSLVLAPDTPVWIDVQEFEAAAARARESSDPALYQAAIDRYTGDLLPEDCYEEWAVERRDALRATYLELLAEMARLCQRRGLPTLAIASLRRLVAEEPLNEEAHAGLIRLYAATGARNQALRQYECLRDRLRRELDTEPSPPTRRLYEEIRDGRFGAGQGATETAGRGAAQAERPETPTNLPASLTSFIGRERSMIQVKRMLAAGRLVTLTGPGGCGKTRLALQVAAEVLADYPDGVWFVDVAALHDPAQVPQAVAAVLHVREAPGRPLLDSLVDVLRRARALLVLDNCEHLFAACGELAMALIGGCPRLRILATSRESLEVPGEALYAVPPLRNPEPWHSLSLSGLMEFPAVRLFVERARVITPDLALTEDNAAAVAEICRRLEGLPLAIELAAARTRMLSVEQILDQLDDPLRLLTGGCRALPERQRTLRATIDWSYNLLSPAERSLFNRLSVFAGSWTLPAAEAICACPDAGGPPVLDLLFRLVDKSLVVVDTTAGDEARYRLLEPLRQYAGERLAECGEVAEVRARHAAYYRTLVEQIEPHLFGPRQAAWLDQLERDYPNIQAALRWMIEQGEAAAGLRMGGALWQFWYRRGHFNGGREWLRALLAQPGAAMPGRERALALAGAATLATKQGDYAEARALFEECLAIRRGLGDPPALARELNGLAYVHLLQGDRAAARPLLDEALAIARETGRPDVLAHVLSNVGLLAKLDGDLAAARRAYEESLALFREVGDEGCIAMLLCYLACVVDPDDPARAAALYEQALETALAVGARRMMVLALTGLARRAIEQGDHPRARGLLEEALTISQRMENRHALAYALDGIARLAAASAQPERALRLAGVVSGLCRASGAGLIPLERWPGRRYVLALRAAVGEAAAERLRREGETMPLAEAIAYALEDGEPGELRRPERPRAANARDCGRLRRLRRPTPAGALPGTSGRGA